MTGKLIWNYCNCTVPKKTARTLKRKNRLQKPGAQKNLKLLQKNHLQKNQNQQQRKTSLLEARLKNEPERMDLRHPQCCVCTEITTATFVARLCTTRTSG